MAPERFDGTPGDPHVDVCAALGLLLRGLLSGLLPRQALRDREGRPRCCIVALPKMVPPRAGADLWRACFRPPAPASGRCNQRPERSHRA